MAVGKRDERMAGWGIHTETSLFSGESITRGCVLPQAKSSSEFKHFIPFNQWGQAVYLNIYGTMNGMVEGLFLALFLVNKGQHRLHVSHIGRGVFGSKSFPTT